MYHGLQLWCRGQREPSRCSRRLMTTVLNACCSILGSLLPGGDIAVLLCCVSLYACCVYIHDYDVAYRLVGHAQIWYVLPEKRKIDIEALVSSTYVVELSKNKSK
ncbi:hypothetical protein EON65_35925 [archaeon]|nr:MAG: hypothetical protein EON65_35925 [archaeon]